MLVLQLQATCLPLIALLQDDGEDTQAKFTTAQVRLYSINGAHSKYAGNVG